MRSHYPVSHLVVAYSAGNHHIAAVNPYAHVLSRHQERIAVMTVLVAVFMADTNPLAHSDPAGKLHVPVTPFGMLVKYLSCLLEQHADPFPCHLFCCGIL
jgi:hypothetical protein